MASKGNGSQELAGTATGPSAFQRLRKQMSEIATLEESDVSGEDINRILEAESEEEMWDADELASFNAKKLSGCELHILFFQVKYGSGASDDIKTPFVDDKGRQMYLLVTAVRTADVGKYKKEINLPPVGEEFQWNTSARNIVGKLFWMLNHGWFDPDSGRTVLVRIEGTPLQGGKSVEKLKPLTPITVGGQVNESEESPF